MTTSSRMSGPSSPGAPRRLFPRGSPPGGSCWIQASEVGFGKSVEGNLALIRGLPRLAELGYPVLLGTSRKFFLGKLTGAPERERTGATLASILPAFDLDRAIVRVHDAEEAVRFRTVWEAIYSDRLRPKG